jgi:hypothetical protein
LKFEYILPQEETHKETLKETNKQKTTCEVIVGVVAIATTIGCIPKHMEKITMTFTCEGKLGLL